MGEHVGQDARSNLPELPNTSFIVGIRWVSNGKDMVLAPKQLQASYTDVRDWEELIDFINKNGGPKEPYILTLMFKCTLEQDELEEEDMGLYTHGQMMNHPIYEADFGQLLPFKCFQVESWTGSENILRRNEESYREGDCRARNETSEGNPH